MDSMSAALSDAASKIRLLGFLGVYRALLSVLCLLSLFLLVFYVLAILCTVYALTTTFCLLHVPQLEEFARMSYYTNRCKAIFNE